MHRPVIFLLCLTLLAMARSASGQRADPIAENLYPPGLLLRHADEVGLDGAQKQFIASQARENRQKFVQMQQELQSQIAALAEIMGQAPPTSRRRWTSSTRSWPPSATSNALN